MMRLFLTLSLCIAAAVSSRAQERIRNVRVRAVDSSQLEIRYDLINTRPGDSVFLEVRSRLRGALKILPEFVRGDIGTRITAGSSRRIVWDALANGYSLNEEIQARVLVKTGVFSSAEPPIPTEPTVVQKAPVPAPTAPIPEAVPPKPTRTEPVVVAAPKPSAPVARPADEPQPVPPLKRPKRGRGVVILADSVATPTPPAVVSVPQRQQPNPRPEPTVEPTRPSPTPAPVEPERVRRGRYAGPAWALVSAVAPGIGNIFVQTPKPKIGLRPLLTVGCYGLLIYGFSERQKAQDMYAIYDQQKNMTAGEPYYQTANDHHHRYFLATRGAIVVAAADVILTFIKGIRNSKIQTEPRRYQSIKLSPGLQAGQPTAVVRYSF